MIPPLSNQNWRRSSVLTRRNLSFQDGPKTKIDFFLTRRSRNFFLIFYYYTELISILGKLILVARVVKCIDGPRRLKFSRNVTAKGLILSLFSSEVLLWDVSWSSGSQNFTHALLTYLQLLGNFFFENLNFGASIPLMLLKHNINLQICLKL